MNQGSTGSIVVVEIRALASSALVRSAVSSCPSLRLWRGCRDPCPHAGEPTTPPTYSYTRTFIDTTKSRCCYSHTTLTSLYIHTHRMAGAFRRTCCTSIFTPPSSDVLCALLSKQDIIWAGPRTSQLLNRDGFRDCLKAGQSVNRIPGMALALRKASLDAALAACRLLRPRGFNFRPRCWNLPAQGDALVAWAQARTRDASWFIIKPDGGSEGRGIVLLAAADLDHAAVREITEREGVCVAEEYIADPMLLEGFKFDLRGKFVVLHICCQLCSEPSSYGSFCGASL